ncbi:hypothetical protein ASPZODRAFT_679089 [Penicilliopsis zonata CBS 506.65]|uniref:LysM domain-containing protein n=1 Tax=Penicilliopsis zonata CBS 506.65 TaxID=1073090 RepID=A0A1L9SD55_9EURO|nr:hypothetical protein ASPZODRAFT_679089 [Penicilliopsis zonata CBS 506.65]OJJ45155.1 hypothetical protein ASPZODRAFT_679089 [Penicilliopsis zonata CBS 506.65]
MTCISCLIGQPKQGADNRSIRADLCVISRITVLTKRSSREYKDVVSPGTMDFIPHPPTISFNLHTSTAMLLLLLALGLPLVHAWCDITALNLTSGVYYTSENETIFEVAEAVNRGVCDIARYNRMADAILPLLTGEEILIPPEVCDPDNRSCLIVPEPNATYADCIMGGPHTYTTLKGDSIAYIALKLNLTVEALLTTAWVPNMGDPDAPVEVGQVIKIPQCYPSQCIVQPGEFYYGTYKDLAAMLGTTPGQLMAFNPTYNHTTASQGQGPWISFSMDCMPLSDNVTAVSL